ncbi:MAG: hypothetical protein COV43_00035 [Deltaproteobacteria bacterium CG11_big_fil_rev_8_21_14_0_20_42_23]|nr:MAG: hypothetical protein COV43_00035 [Deltaproteobacteria bacterium CG11_big_fil_rev_8_21_14_0_20_42_23]PJC64854.1 MAG: hypothetical protein CO021_02115 [Deltaproteobacteria bacterium CG_4_9_14_0_2_um_filter_42_21]
MWIVFVGVNSSFEHAFRAAHELGFKVLFITSEHDFPKTIPADLTQTVQSFEFDIILSIIEESLPRDQTLVFWALKEALLPLVRKLNLHFKSPARFYSENTMVTCKNKLRLRNLLAHTPYNPQFEIYTEGCQYQAHVQSNKKIIKPLHGRLSIGVELVSSEEDFLPAISRSLSVLERLSSDTKFYSQLSEGHDLKRTLLIEEFIEGAEFSVEIFANEKGIKCMGICEKTKMKPPYFEEISYCSPPRIEKELSAKLASAAIEIASIIGLESGMAHFEFKYDGKRIILLDIGLRLGGGGLVHGLISTSTGVDLIKAVLAELCGLDSELYLMKTRNDTALLYLLQIGDGGIVQMVTQPTKMNSVALVDMYVFVKKGDYLSGYPNYSNLPGYALFQISGRNEMSFTAVDNAIEHLMKNWNIQYQ